MLFLDKKVN